MPTFSMVPTANLVEPENPQRVETLLERIDELRDSIRTNGLQQPIGVVAQTDGQYRIVWGHRRSIAVTQLGWAQIAAMVYQPGEADTDTLMGAENYHRTNTSDAEEAIYYARILPKYAEGTIGLARELNVPERRIGELLRCLEGDPRVFTALSHKAVSLAQAVEINKFKSPGYRLQALERAVTEGTSAHYLRRWRSEIQRQGMDDNAVAAQTAWNDAIPTTPTVPTDICNIGNHEVPLQERKVYAICHEHYNVFLAGLEALGKQRIIEENGYLPEFIRLLRKAEADNG